MKNRLQLVPSLIILAYAGIFIGGRTVHEHFCQLSRADCCEDLATSAYHLSLTANSICCPTQHSKAITAKNPVDKDTDPKDRSSDCWTCYTLSQAGNSSAEIYHPAVTQMVFLSCSDYEDRRLQSYTHNFLVRGPPEIHSATS